MATLSKDLRRQLERTVAEARMIAEEGAEQSLHHLAVDLPRPHDKQSDDDKRLRVSLRAHAKQLGDRLDQRPIHLKQAVAYEHWHRLLFARFLIENDLLLHPEHGVALSLDEVKEIALAENREWVEVAADYAQRMLLRRVFQPDDPALRVPLSPEKRQQLEQKLNSLPKEVFLADDSLGWVYQFWQRDEKDRVNKSEAKIGADELPAVTQLFTEDYMVLFLLENTLGAWWTAKRRAEGKDPKLPGYEWTHLGVNEDGSPVAGPFEGWPCTARDLRLLDPCMGSGHFLVFALPILTRMRMEEEALSIKDAVASVLADNLFGLEIDGRCAQIAAFNVALAAWRLAGQHFPVPEMNLACSGLGINALEADWIRLASEDGPAREEMRRLYSLFREAPTLGSLIDPLRFEANLITAGAAKVLPLIEEALEREQSDESRELAIAARGVLAAFRILAARFTLVATNVPYLGRGKQDPILARYCGEFHSEAKADLATCFVDRCLRFAEEGGTAALVTPQNWLFLTSYKKLRERLLRTEKWNFVARLGEHAFDSPAAAGAFVALLGLTRRVPSTEHTFAAWEVSDLESCQEKAHELRTGRSEQVLQTSQMLNPDARVSLRNSSGPTRLNRYANSFLGLGTGDYSHYGRCFWEFPSASEGWTFQQGSVTRTVPWGGREHMLCWDEVNQRVRGMSQAEKDQIHNQDQSGQQAWGRKGIAVSLARELRSTIYTGEKFDKAVAVLVPTDEDTVPALWSFCATKEFDKLVRELDRKVIAANGTLVKIPFDLAYWQRVAAETYPHGMPQPYSHDPTQWLFDGGAKGCDHPLQVAVARLVGYRWPRQSGTSFPDCPALESDGLEVHADDDGIVTLNSLGGSPGAAERLRALLADVYGPEWSAAKLAELIGDCDSLEVWLRDRFFEEHCEIFHQRPFIWQLWDGRKDGFHAFVNYHALDHKALEKLIYSTLGDWISRQRQDVEIGIEGADGRLASAEHLQSELKKILHGESPYDIFVRWKPVREQPLGWNPDLNDGVRLNLRPWVVAAKLYRATKPGILRVTPNIKFGKDRGKDPAREPKDFPWSNGSRERDNDIHVTLEEKRKARGMA